MAGFDPISMAVISGGLQLGQGVLSNMQASQTYDNQLDALEKQRKQNIMQAEFSANVQSENLSLDLMEFMGAVASNALDRGITGGNTAYALQTAAVAKAVRSKDIIDAEEVFQIAGVYADEHAQAQSLRPNQTNPLMAGLAGGLSGYDAALSRKLSEAALNQYTNSNSGTSEIL